MSRLEYTEERPCGCWMTKPPGSPVWLPDDSHLCPIGAVILDAHRAVFQQGRDWEHPSTLAAYREHFPPSRESEVRNRGT